MSGNEVKRFLVVNSDMVLGESVRKILEETFSVKVDLESESSKALERLTRENYQIVISDFSLTDGDCFELLREISVRNIDTCPIVVAPRGDEQLAARSLVYGAVGCVVRYRNYFRELREAVGLALAGFEVKQ
ncbi:MAG: response regulator [Actinobacteria bacterium]|nr:response regulator [Actinomycetota bacterium]